MNTGIHESGADNFDRETGLHRLLKLVEHCKTVSMNIYLILNCYLVQPHSFLLSPIHAYFCREALILINPDERLSSLSGLIGDQKHLCKKNSSLY